MADTLPATYTMAEVIGITGLSERTIRRYIKKGKLMADTLPAQNRHPAGQGKKTAIAINKKELDRFLNEQKNTMADTLPGTMPAPDRHPAGTLPDIKEIVKEAIQEQQSAIMKPLEQQALYRLGRVEQENEFLKQKLDTVLQELEKLKALPLDDLTEEVEKLKEDLSWEMEQKKKLQEQISILPDSPLNVNKILMQNADNINLLQEKLSILPAEPEKINQILKLSTEKLTALEDNFIKQSQEKEHLEAELKKVQEQAEEMRQRLNKPWYKFW